VCRKLAKCELFARVGQVHHRIGRPVFQHRVHVTAVPRGEPLPQRTRRSPATSPTPKVRRLRGLPRGPRRTRRSGSSGCGR
jgi:hypothetical protein